MEETKCTPSLFSHTEPDPAGIILGTGYNRFDTIWGVNGLAKWEGQRLDILAIDSDKHGAGHVRLFIEQAKKHFTEIYFWHLMNPILERALQGYDFKPAKQIEHGEKMEGCVWKSTDKFPPRPITK